MDEYIVTRTNEQRYVVRRIYNRHGDADFLIGWDIIWGPVWSRPRGNALTFDAGEVRRAVESAVAIMAPRPWCVPDFGTHSRVHSSYAPYPGMRRDE